ncbi:MAG: flagellar biosynthesis regulator FlaF [Pseudomonadota bacterium]
MNATQLAQTAYGSGTRSVRTPRGVEYEAFARVTSRLKAIASDMAQAKRQQIKSKTKRVIPGQFSDLATALNENRTLWTLLATDVADDGNKLPDDLRARILYLAEFTRQHSAKVLKSQASVVPLLEINIAIMRGLRAQGGPETPSSKVRVS